MNDFKKGGFKKGGGDFGGRPKFGNKFGGGDRKFGGGSKFGGGKFGGDRKFGNKFGGSRGGDKPFGRPELFPATCSSCGKPCEVPFRPTGEKPVYCRDCFQKQEQAPWRADERRDRPQREFRPRQEFSPAQGGGDIEGLKHRILSLEGKLDRILAILGKDVKASTPKVEKTGEELTKDLSGEAGKAKDTAFIPKKEKKAKKVKK